MTKYLAEFIGSFLLVFIGTGATIINTTHENVLGLQGVAAVFGLTVFFLVYLLGPLSGGHLNPAVSIANCVRGLLAPSTTCFYILVQLLGALLASSVLYLLFPTAPHLGETLPTAGITISFIFEFLVTSLLFAVLIASERTKENLVTTSLLLGLLVYLGVVVAGPLSGGSFNPARSIGPAMVSGNYNGIWIYCTAPIAGATLVALVYKLNRHLHHNSKITA